MSSYDGRWLDAIEHEMAPEAVAIADARLSLASALGRAERERQELTALFPRFSIALHGDVEDALGELSATAAEDRYLETLASMRSRDAAAKRTLSGPHRSAIEVRHLDKDMPAALCSTGEQKALLVGLTLAHARIVRDQRQGRVPVLLLDEIAAHLDDMRRMALFETLVALGGQTFMTGTDRVAFDPLADQAQFFEVRSGVVSPEDPTHAQA